MIAFLSFIFLLFVIAVTLVNVSILYVVLAEKDFEISCPIWIDAEFYFGIIRNDVDGKKHLNIRIGIIYIDNKDDNDNGY